MIVLDKQAEANRRNAKKSTGPKSEAGKATSARNATRHGVLSTVAVAAHEDAEQYEALQAQLKAEHGPCTTVEHMLVEQLTLLYWCQVRLARAEAFETTANSLTFENERSVEAHFPASPRSDRSPRELRAEANILPIDFQLKVGRYQTMLLNQIDRVLKQLREQKAARADTIDVQPAGDTENPDNGAPSPPTRIRIRSVKPSGS